MHCNEESSAAANATLRSEELRRRHDQAAFAAARDPARHGALALLEALDRQLPPHELAPIADAAMRAAGALWETAARLSE